MRVCEADLQLLVMSPEGDVLKAKLPHRSEHPRALMTVLEGLAMWQGGQLEAVHFCVGSRYLRDLGPRSKRGLVGGMMVGVGGLRWRRAMAAETIDGLMAGWSRSSARMREIGPSGFRVAPKLAEGTHG